MISCCSSQLLTQLIEFLQPQHIKSKDNSPSDRPMIPLPETAIPVFTHCIAGHCTNIYLQLDENGMKHKKKYYYKILYDYSLFLQFTVHDPANFQICNRSVRRTIVLALMFASRKIFKFKKKYFFDYWVKIFKFYFFSLFNHFFEVCSQFFKRVCFLFLLKYTTGR